MFVCSFIEWICNGRPILWYIFNVCQKNCTSSSCDVAYHFDNGIFKYTIYSNYLSLHIYTDAASVSGRNGQFQVVGEPKS